MHLIKRILKLLLKRFMSSKEEEYKEMFLAEAFDSFEELNTLFTHLEKDVKNKKVVDSIFRITHTLKGNAMGLGFEAIAELSHVMEDIFSEVKQGNIELDLELFTSLFKANDKLGALINGLKEGKKVSYKGIRTKLSVLLTEAKNTTTTTTTTTESESISVDEKVLKTEVTEIAPIAEVSEEEEGHHEELDEEIDEHEGIEEDSSIAFSDLIQVPVRKMDSLLNLVGELIIERDSLVAASLERGYGTGMFARLQRITSDLQYGVMDIRLVQVGFLFNKFHRIIRDVAVIEDKKVDLVLEGTETEIDRSVLKIISDSLVHVIRNSVSHGIESPQEREQKGKPAIGEVILRARNDKENVIIDVQDDGAGIDTKVIAKKAIEKGLISKEFAKRASKNDILMLIFEPGFSNAETVTAISGRGVGMDVVKRAAESIGGKVEVTTELGKGTTISIHLPSSMAVKGALLFELDKQEYAIALNYTEAVVSLKKPDLHRVSGGLMTTYLGKVIPLVFLKDLFSVNKFSELSTEGTLHQSYHAVNDTDKLEVIIASYGGRHVGFVVDKLFQQKEIVEKTLSQPIDRIDMISGATILGNGSVCLVLDIARIMNSIFKEQQTV
jgi:two-component system chemotaxis sensor kinase CheA